jgi:amino acid transporter
MLAYTIYSFYFIALYNTAANALQFSNQILISANAGDNIDSTTKQPDFIPDGRLLRFIAVTVLTGFCLIHYFSRRIGRSMLNGLALIKICMLLIVLIAGFVKAFSAAPGANTHPDDWTLPLNPSPSSTPTAILLIIFSFQGWENATFASTSRLL